MRPTTETWRRNLPTGRFPAVLLLLLGLACSSPPPPSGTGSESTNPTDATVLAKPPGVVSAIDHAKARTGREITLIGQHLVNVVEVRFNGVLAPVFSEDGPGGTRLKVTVPDHAKSGPISVKRRDGTVAISKAVFTLLPTPTLLASVPATAPAGHEVDLSGTHLKDVVEVWFNDARAPAFREEGRGGALLRVTVPTGATPGKIRLKFRDGHVLASRIDFVVSPPPPPAGARRGPVPAPPPSRPVRSRYPVPMLPVPPVTPLVPGPPAPDPLRADREAGANRPEVQIAWINALLTRIAHTRARHAYSGRLFGARMDMTLEYDLGREALEAIKRQPRAPGDASEYHINYAYLDADPYLRVHNQDIDDRVPGAVTDAQFNQILQTIRHLNIIPYEDIIRIDATINSAVDLQKMRLRKRIKWIFDEARTRTDRCEMDDRDPTLTPLVRMCLDLDRQVGRCQDGLNNGLTEVEIRMFNSGAGPDHIGEFISSVLTDYKMAFIRKHMELDPRDAEFTTMIVEELSQTMLYSMGLRGRFAPLAYPHHPVVDFPLFKSAAVMRRFLLGEQNVRHPAGTVGIVPPVQFDAYNVDKMIDLLQTARERGFSEPNGRVRHRGGNPKSVLANRVIEKELVNPADYTPVDPRMGPSFAAFALMGFAGDSAYFLSPRPTDGPTDFRLKRAFWLYMLRKYNYIVPW